VAKFESYNALLDEVMGELEERGAETENERKNRKPKKSSGKKKKSAEPEKKTPVMEIEDDLSLPDLDLNEEEPKDDYEITEDGEPAITNPVTFSSSAAVSRKIGEEVTEEYVNDLMEKEEAPVDGRRATVIIHTRTVTEKTVAEQEEPQDDYEIPEETPVPEPKKEKPASVIRLIKEDTGEAFDLHSGRQTIGQDEDNDIVIPEPDGHYISGHHASFTVDEKGNIMLVDGDGKKRSTNHTYVNGIKIGSRYVRDGDRIKLADVYFILSVDKK